tara:strand:+ start:100 stop:324 length:225 start_codon:yes stop_codon:yes gene_type:complete
MFIWHFANVSAEKKMAICAIIKYNANLTKRSSGKASLPRRRWQRPQTVRQSIAPGKVLYALRNGRVNFSKLFII